MDEAPSRLLGHRRAYLVSGVVIVLAVLLLPEAWGAGLLFHQQCTLTTLGTESLWTPAVIVEAPPNGSAIGWANGSVLGEFEGISRSLGNGSAAIAYANLTWTVARTSMEWASGAGTADRCTVPYWAGVRTPTTTPLAWCVMQGPGNTSDRNLSTDLPVPGCSFLSSAAVVGFNDSFSDAPCPAGSTVRCVPTDGIDESVGTTILYRENIVGYPVEIPLPGPPTGSSISASDPVTQSVSYLLTGGGCWSYQWNGVTPPAQGGLMVWGPHGSVSTGPSGARCSLP